MVESPWKSPEECLCQSGAAWEITEGGSQAPWGRAGSCPCTGGWKKAGAHWLPVTLIATDETRQTSGRSLLRLSASLACRSISEV